MLYNHIKKVWQTHCDNSPQSATKPWITGQPDPLLINLVGLPGKLSLSVGTSHTVYAGSGLPYGSMPTSVLKTSDICTYFIHFLPHSNILFLLIILGGLSSSRRPRWRRGRVARGPFAAPRPAQLSLLDLFFSLIFYNLLVSVVISSCIIWDLLCICGGFLRGFCPHSNQGSRKEGAVHSTHCKAHWDDAKLLFLATYTKLT